MGSVLEININWIGLFFRW